MIGDFIFSIVALTLSILGILFSAIQFVIPAQIQNSILYVLSFTQYMTGIFPVNEVLYALGTYSIFQGGWYTYKLILALYGLMPWIGKHHKGPTIHN